MSRTVKIMLAGVAAAAAVGAGTAVATTGAGAGLPYPKIHVDPGIMGQYLGLFEFSRVDRRAKIIGAEMAIDYTELPPAYPIGRITVRGYDPTGHQTSYSATLYNFSGDAKTGDVHGQLLNQGDNSVMGEIDLRDPKANSVKGTLHIDGLDYDFAANRYDDDDGPPPDSALVQTGPRFEHATKPGWGADPKVAVGGYTLVNPAVDPGAGAGVYAQVVRAASTIDATTPPAPTGGSLTVTDDGGTLAGTMQLESADTQQTLFLTNLKWGGASRAADLHTGSADGPKVGTFEGTVVDGELSGTVTVGGKATDVGFSIPSASS